MFILHMCSAMLLIYSNYHHNSFCSYKFSFLQIAKSVLASTLFTSLCTFLFHPVFAAFSLFLPFFTFLGRMDVYARSHSSGRGSSIGIKALTSYRLNKIKFSTDFLFFLQENLLNHGANLMELYPYVIIQTKFDFQGQIQK